MSESAALLNEGFFDKMQSAEGMTKLASYQADYVKDRLLEETFTSKIMTPKTVTRADLQVSVNHDTLVKMVQTEMATRAMVASYRGQPDVAYIQAPRYEVPFYAINSLRYEYNEDELMAYDIPIVDMVAKKMTNDIGEIRDRQFLLLCETAVEALQKEANSVAYTSKFSDSKAFTARNIAVNSLVEKGKVKGVDAVNNTVAAFDADGLYEDLIYPLQKDDLVKLFKTFVGRGGKGSRLRAEQVLLTDYDFEDLNLWTISDNGDKIVGETTVEGYKYKTLIGRTYQRTLKTDIARPGSIWAFAPEEYLGGFMILRKQQVWNNRDMKKYAFQGGETIGMHIGNVSAVRKLELFTGSVDDTSTANTTYSADYLPEEEENLGKLNNLVAEGQSFPQVSGF